MGERRVISGRRKDGSEFPAAAGISKLEQGGQQLFAVILRDVTEQRRLEDEARTQSTQTAITAERNRLARELHDAVTQSLFSASIMAEVLPKLWESDREKGLAQLQDIRQLTRSALAEMRTLLLELRPTAIMDSKLSELLAQLAEATSCRSGVNVTVQADEQRHLPGEVQVAFYRIAQEALHNVSKHSKAQQAQRATELAARARPVYWCMMTGAGLNTRASARRIWVCASCTSERRKWVQLCRLKAHPGKAPMCW